MKKKSVKTFSAAVILDHFWAKMVKSENTSFHYFSPRILNLSTFWTSDFGKGGGAKRRLNGTSKVNTRTHTHRHFNLQKASAQRADALKISANIAGFLALVCFSLCHVSLFKLILAYGASVWPHYLEGHKKT